MSKITVWFIKCSMVYFVLAAAIGIHMTVAGPVYPLLQIHAHLNLLGWITMMIFGVAYHILPRFSGTPLWSERLASIQFWAANIGLVGMAVSWLVRQWHDVSFLLLLFSLIEALSVILFVINIFKTIKRA